MRRDAWYMRNNKMTNNLMLSMGASSVNAFSLCLSLWIPISVAFVIFKNVVKNNDWNQWMLIGTNGACVSVTASVKFLCVLFGEWVCARAIRSRLALEFSIKTYHKALDSIFIYYYRFWHVWPFFSLFVDDVVDVLFSVLFQNCVMIIFFVSSVGRSAPPQQHRKHKKIMENWK